MPVKSVIDIASERPETVPVICIDPQFRALIPPLSKRELAGLEESLILEGCRDALTVWQETRILLDGHNRLTLCSKRDIPYRIVEISLADSAAAKTWIIANQRKSRRNLTAMGVSYLRGQFYLASKRAGRRTDLMGHNVQRLTTAEQPLANDLMGHNAQRLTTAQQIAAEDNVAEKTVRRDAAFSLAVDLLAKNCGEDVKEVILSSDAPLTRKDTERLAQLSPRRQRRWIAKVRKSCRRPDWPNHIKRRSITLPREPAALAAALARRLSAAELQQTVEFLEGVLSTPS